MMDNRQNYKDEEVQKIAPYPYNGPCGMWFQTHGTYDNIPTEKEWYDSIRERIQNGEFKEEICAILVNSLNTEKRWIKK